MGFGGPTGRMKLVSGGANPRMGHRPMATTTALLRSGNFVAMAPVSHAGGGSDLARGSEHVLRTARVRLNKTGGFVSKLVAGNLINGKLAHLHRHSVDPGSLGPGESAERLRTLLAGARFLRLDRSAGGAGDFGRRADS